MPTVDFIRRERLVRVAGRAFRVGPPTVGTVSLFLELLAEHALATARAFADGVLSPETPPEDLVGVFSRAPEFPEILATCVRDERGLPALELASLDRVSLETLALASLRLCDLRRVIDSLGLDEALRRATAGERALDFGFDVPAYVHVSTAQACHVSPLELAAWPWEAWLTVRESLSVTREQLATASATPLEAGAIPGLGFGGGAA